MLWLLPFLSSPTQKVFYETAIKFGTKPLNGVVMSEEEDILFLRKFF
jgi:hypothetical protein